MIQNYTSTNNRYSFFIKTRDCNKIKIYYDTKIGKFYKDIDENIREYINIHEYIT